MTAIPLVKPVTTGYGMNLIAAPKRARPRIMRRMPARIVQIVRPSTPWRATIPDTITTNAPVGPPIWTRLPPRNEMRKPATAAVTRPRLRRHSRGDREGDRERDGDDPDDHAGLEIGEELSPRVTGERGECLRQPRPGHESDSTRGVAPARG